jgi:prepilin-type N-terminal cleavage/methylation domain-containing protein
MRTELKPKEHAFTLIELLVVVAIVGILAGLLFPVLAQAQVAAKESGSISNVRQIVLASLMYASDNDDGLPLFANGNALEVGATGSYVTTWVDNLQPYLRSLGVMVDPLMGDPHGFFGSGPNATVWNQSEYPDYGVNYVFLAPWLKDPDTGACTLSGSVIGSGASHPSTTIFYVTSYEPNEDEYGNPTGGYTNYGNWTVTAPGVLSLLKNDPRNCVSPGMDWSEHPIGFNGSEPFTAEASQRYGGGMVTAMLDGHAQRLSADQAAAGTDWATSAYTHTRILHAGLYMWDYDGSFFGATVGE